MLHHHAITVLAALRALIHDDVREWDRPSDHAPVTVDLDV
mgnify:CR=1 FL=1